MKASAIPSVLPAHEPLIADALPASPKRRRGEPLPLVILGWFWRLPIGVLFCLTFFTSIFVTGWLYRWMQGIVLYGWWRRSRWCRPGSRFEDFCATLGHDAPVLNPRWFWQERVIDSVTRPTAEGKRPEDWRTVARYLVVPWQSLWLNFRTGFAGLFCTYLLTGWGCLLMMVSWWFGWLNSFHKGYELAFVGPSLGILGIVLFIAAMLYVPMAQVHQAATGDARAFFEFRFVWRLIQARPTAYVGLAALIALASVPLQIMQSFQFFFESAFGLEEATDQEVQQAFFVYRLFCTAFLFLCLLVLRLSAALLYRSAVLAVLRRGWVAPSEVHPTLANWLTRLDYWPPLPESPEQVRWGMGSLMWWTIGSLQLFVLLVALAGTIAGGPVVGAIILGVWVAAWCVLGALCLVLRGGLRRYIRFTGWTVAFGLLFWIWFAFIAKAYVGEFICIHPFWGFLNFPLIHFPCMGFGV